jgi:hypothetical protein
LSFSVDLTQSDTADGGASRQDFSMQATTLPINGSPFLATIKVLTASNPIAGCGHCRLKTSLK